MSLPRWSIGAGGARRAGDARELARVVRPPGRAYVTAWVPDGPIDGMLAARSQVLGRLGQAPPPRRFAWSDAGAVRALAGEAGLALDRTSAKELAIRAPSPEAYVKAWQNHPVALSVRPVIERAGAGDEVQAAMTAVLRHANEDPGAFLIHSPYVVHELRVA